MKRWLAASVLVLSLVLPSRPAAAQQWEDYDYENLEFRGLGLEVGAVWPAGVEPAVMVGTRGDLGFVGPRVRVVPALRFWSSRLDQEEVDRLSAQIRQLCERQGGGSCPSFELGEIDRSDLEISADAHYMIPTGYTVEPYLGGGLSLHLLNGSGAAIDDTFVEDLLDTVSPGVDLLGGVNVPLGRSIQLVAEARLVLVSDVRYAGLLAGASWSLPTPTAAQKRSARRAR